MLNMILLTIQKCFFVNIVSCVCLKGIFNIESNHCFVYRMKIVLKLKLKISDFGENVFRTKKALYFMDKINHFISSLVYE